tara:strand:- start:1019 stop:1519 length:501 start_codon:yes stop_codon:yes gene_type:complete
MSIYSLDYSIFANEFLPPDKRGTVQNSWQKALLTPEQNLHNEVFITYRPDVIARSKHNGQKVVMEAVLNETFNIVSLPFIYIDNSGDDVAPITLFNETEGYPAVTFYNSNESQPGVFLFNTTEANTNNEFKVYVPAATYNAQGEAKIAAEVDRLRPYSTNYIIISY